MATIYVGSARIDERGKLSGGQAGDQKQTSSTNDTKGEVAMQPFYVHSKGWYILRPKKIPVANKMAKSDFSQKCKITGKDEVGQLSKSINYLSFELDKTITELNVKNEKGDIKIIPNIPQFVSKPDFTKKEITLLIKELMD